MSPPLVDVATNESTRPGTPPVAYVRKTESVVTANAESADCSPANADVGSALFSLTDWLRTGCVSRSGATAIATVDCPPPAEDSALTRKWYISSTNGDPVTTSVIDKVVVSALADA